MDIVKFHKTRVIDGFTVSNGSFGLLQDGHLLAVTNREAECETFDSISRVLIYQRGADGWHGDYISLYDWHTPKYAHLAPLWQAVDNARYQEYTQTFDWDEFDF